jgi:asparagine synthase (glutamine-hydrolysing)
MLRATREAAGDTQPASLEQRLWITADARIDCRTELLEELVRAGRRVETGGSDSALILQAYDAWGEHCLAHLRGDFAFAIWDAARKQLFCARDHFGIKPFFYAVKEDIFLFSNTLNCLRMHPEISAELNEAAIGDFLLFGLNCDISATAFRDVQRLPAAHFLMVSSDQLRRARYWSPPTGGHIRYQRAEEYVEHFNAVLKCAVADRLRIDRAGILLSGGLDSAAVASTARELRADGSGTPDLRAYTIVHETLFDDREGLYARQTAEHLQIPIELLTVDHRKPFASWEEPARFPPEPVDDPFYTDHFAVFETIATDRRVALSGEGADNLLDFQMWPYARDLLRRHEWMKLCADTAHFLWIRPFPWRGVRERLAGLAGRKPADRKFPEWIAADFASRLGLAERWRQCQLIGPPVHPVRPRAHATLALPHWNYVFEYADPGVTMSAVEVRYPFLDLRVVDYLLALPPFPWCYKKTLLRNAMACRLPQVTLRRAKTPLPFQPSVEALQREEARWLSSLKLSGEINRYVNPFAVGPIGGERSSEKAQVTIRPLCLNFWLQSARKVRYNFKTEVL